MKRQGNNIIEYLIKTIIYMQQEFISEDCSWYLAQLGWPKQESSTWILSTYSGLGMNRLGLYQECLQEPDEKYFLIEGVTELTSEHFFVGVCHHQNCTASDFYYIAESVKQYIKPTFQIVRIEEPAAFTKEYTLIEYIVLTLIMLYLLGMLVCTVYKRVWGWKGRHRKVEAILNEFTLDSPMRVLAERTSNNDRIKVFTGLKVFSLIGMIISNTCFVVFVTPAEPMQKQIHPLFYLLNSLSSDVWLFLSGFYFAFELLKSYLKHQTYKILIKGFLRRFLRIWIISLLAMMLVNYVVRFIGAGPIWQHLYTFLQTQCGQTWIPHFFLISNYFNHGCDYFLWVWEIQVQLNLFILPLLMIRVSSLYRKHFIFYGCQVLLVIGSFLCLLGESNPSIDNLSQKWSLVRCMPYLIGFNLGISFCGFRCQRNKKEHYYIRLFRIHQVRVICGLVGLAMLVGCCFLFLYVVEKEITVLGLMLINVVHGGWVLGVMLIILPSLVGYPSIARRFLSAWILRSMSKLTFSAYAVQYSIISLIAFTRQNDLYFSPLYIVEMAACNLALVWLGSLILTLLVDIPVYRTIAKVLRWDNQKYIEY